MYMEVYQTNEFCRITPVTIQFYSLEDTKLDQLFDKPIDIFPYNTIPNSTTLINKRTICQSYFSNGNYVNKFTNIDDLLNSSITFATNEPIQNILSAQEKIFYRMNNQIYALSNDNISTLLVQNENKIQKFEIGKNILYYLVEGKNSKTLSAYDFQRKIQLWTRQTVIDFELDNEIPVILQYSLGQVHLNNIPIGINQIQNDAFTLKVVPVKNSKSSITIITHLQELNMLYYIYQGNKYKSIIQNSLPSSVVSQLHQAQKLDNQIQYRVLTSQNRYQTDTVNNLDIYPEDERFMINNMKYVFVNGIVNSHFIKDISVFYKKNYLRYLPFGIQDQQQFKQSINNSYQLFKILIIQYHQEFTEVYNNVEQHFNKFSLYINQFIKQMANNYEVFAFSLEFLDVMFQSIAKVKDFYHKQLQYYAQHLNHVYGSQTGVKASIVKKLLPFQQIKNNLDVFEGVLKLIELQITQQNINAFYNRHKQVKNKFLQSNYKFKTIVEYFNNFQNFFQRLPVSRQQFIRTLFNLKKFDIAYIGYALFRIQATQQLKLSSQQQEAIIIYQNLVFNNRIQDGSKSVNKLVNSFDQNYSEALIHLLIALGFSSQALSVLYSQPNRLNDVELFADLHSITKKIGQGYLTIAGLFDDVVGRKNTVGRQDAIKTYFKKCFNNGAVMQLVQIGAEMCLKDKMILSKIGKEHGLEIDDYIM